MITTQTMLASTTFGVPAGNYDGSSQDWYSNAVRAADYYRGRGGLQTVTISVDNFVGILKIEATLDYEPDSVDTKWFDTYIYSDGITPITDYHPETITGNFTWMRVRVEGFDGGTINSVTITY